MQYMHVWTFKTGSNICVLLLLEPDEICVKFCHERQNVVCKVAFPMMADNPSKIEADNSSVSLMKTRKTISADQG